MRSQVLNNMVIQLGDDSDCVNVTLHKTVRIPEDGKTYPLPPSLGIFPVHKVDDYRDNVPKEWLKTGGVFFCMHQAEAMWMKFDKVGPKRKAMKVGIGKINAVNGKTWRNDLSKNDSDYMVIPDQKWLDGIASGKNTIKQFVAMPLGSQTTVEYQVSGKEDIGGIQLLSYNSKKNESRRIIRKPIPQPIYPGPIDPPLPGPVFPPHPIYPGPVVPMNMPPVVCESQSLGITSDSFGGGFGGGGGGYCVGGFGGGGGGQFFHNASSIRRKSKRKNCSSSKSRKRVIGSSSRHERRNQDAKEIGLAAGGTMKQKVYEDRYGYDTWDQSKYSRIFVHIVNSEMYEQITGEKAPEREITAKTYTQYGYPWFDVYDEGKNGVGGGQNQILKNVKCLKQMKEEKNIWPKEDNETVEIKNVVKIGSSRSSINPNYVRDGSW